MSAGKFERNGKYESDVGNVYRCRPQPETRIMRLGGRFNGYPPGALTPGLGSLTLRRSARSQGVIPRYVIVRLTGPMPSVRGDYLGVGTTHKVVVFRLSSFLFYGVGTVGTYLGAACVLHYKQPEVLR